MRHEPLRRRFLFLQGPPGPFFWRLAQALIRHGHLAFRINLNGGDRRDWHGTATDYRGTADRWPDALHAYIRANWITDVVLFGDCRPLHRAARRVAEARGMPVHVFEEGYIRPDWVTLERGGVNGHSSLPRDAAWYRAQAERLPPVPDRPPVGFSFRRRARDAIAYYASTIAQHWRFPGYRSHRVHGPVMEGIGWLRRFARARRSKARSEAGWARIAQGACFVFPLQLDSDAQVRVHSPFADVRAALRHVIASFARAAPADARLVVKLHPLDNALIDWRRETIEAARRAGVADRVTFLEDGDIARIVAAARGVVTINSTTGTLALAAGVPTVALGDAVYNLAGLTHQAPLDTFWTAPVAPDPATWDAFRRVLVDRCLIRGGFLSDEGLDLLVAGAVARLTQRVRHG